MHGENLRKFTESRARALRARYALISQWPSIQYSCRSTAVQLYHRSRSTSSTAVRVDLVVQMRMVYNFTHIQGVLICRVVYSRRCSTSMTSFKFSRVLPFAKAGICGCTDYTTYNASTPDYVPATRTQVYRYLTDAASRSLVLLHITFIYQIFVNKHASMCCALVLL